MKTDIKSRSINRISYFIQLINTDKCNSELVHLDFQDLRIHKNKVQSRGQNGKDLSQLEILKCLAKETQDQFKNFRTVA